MRLCYHPRLSEQLAAAPLPIRTAFDRKLRLQVRDLRHPSLRAKKYDEATAPPSTRSWLATRISSAEDVQEAMEYAARSTRDEVPGP